MKHAVDYVYCVVYWIMFTCMFSECKRIVPIEFNAAKEL